MRRHILRALASGERDDYDEKSWAGTCRLFARPALSDPVMNQNPPAATSRTAAAPQPTRQLPIRQPLDRKAIAVALAGIRTDSQREPATYLRDTVVPHGGE
jgi:hypothetical protein